jgi:hypothetical protein
VIHASATGLPDRHLNVMPKDTLKKKQNKKKIIKNRQTNFNTFFILTSHENLQIHVITIVPTGMSGTYGINLV